MTTGVFKQLVKPTVNHTTQFDERAKEIYQKIKTLAQKCGIPLINILAAREISGEAVSYKARHASAGQEVIQRAKGAFGVLETNDTGTLEAIINDWETLRM